MTQEAQGSRQVVGTPCSPGVVRGELLLLAYPWPDTSGQEADQMVWVIDGPLSVEIVLMAVGRAAGLIARTGGATCHGATLAREAGIPAISGVLGFDVVKRASACTMNGDTGTVDLLMGCDP